MTRRSKTASVPYLDTNRRHDPSPPSPSSPYMTYEEFLEAVDEDSRAEWVDGVIEFMSSPVSLPHQRIITFLTEVLSVYIRIHALGEVTTAPFQMKLPRSGREPDVIFVAQDHLGRFEQNFLQGPADLVVEVVSPESVVRDQQTKLAEYQEGGVPEYWLIDPRPRRKRATFYQLDDAGRYQVAPPDSTGVYRSRAVSGFWLRVAWLWQQPLPDPTRILLEIDRDAYAAYLREQLRDAGL